MNKKLIKMIASIACGLGVATSIPFAATSCGCSSKDDVIPLNALPYEVYEVDQRNVLLGFTDEFLANPTAYDMCNIMQIPARVTSIDHSAFEKDLVSLIPSFIKNLIFANGSNCSTIGQLSFAYNSSLTSIDLSNCNNLVDIYPAAFSHCTAITSINLLNCVKLRLISSLCFSDCSSLTSASFPSNLSTIGSAAFSNCSNFNSIIWNEWRGGTSIGSDAFSGISSTGVVKVTNPIDAEHDSAALLASLKTFTSGFPSTGWDSI